MMMVDPKGLSAITAAFSGMSEAAAKAGEAFEELGVALGQFDRCPKSGGSAGQPHQWDLHPGWSPNGNPITRRCIVCGATDATPMPPKHYTCMFAGCGLRYAAADWCPNGHGADTWADAMRGEESRLIADRARDLAARNKALKASLEETQVPELEPWKRRIEFEEP